MRQLIRGVLLSLLLVGGAHAAIDAYEFDNESDRQRYKMLIEELRCPKCQNQNIADSNAPIAMDLRREIYRMLEQGQSNEQIVDYLVDRYGDFVRYKPPVNSKTLVLWYGPAALLVVGFGVLALILIRRRRGGATAGQSQNTLSEAERERLASLLDKKEP